MYARQVLAVATSHTDTSAETKTGKLQNKMLKDTKISCVTVFYVRLLIGFWFKSLI